MIKKQIQIGLTMILPVVLSGCTLGLDGLDFGDEDDTTLDSGGPLHTDSSDSNDSDTQPDRFEETDTGSSTEIDSDSPTDTISSTEIDSDSVSDTEEQIIEEESETRDSETGEVEQCPPGTVLSDSGGSSDATRCESCQVGSYCAGGESQAETCNEGTWDHDESPATACQDWTKCVPGTYVSNAPSSTIDRVCSPCDEGHYTKAPNASVCTKWTVCSPGTYVNKSPSSAEDRVCSTCTDGFTNIDNAEKCAPWTVCSAGTYVSTRPTAAIDRVCVACSSGFTNAANAENCAPWTVCSAGTYVSTRPTAARDRVCTACTMGFSDTNNANKCSPWTVCGPGTTEDAPPTLTSDRTCSYYHWDTTFGSDKNDIGYGITSSGQALYVTGYTKGTLPGEISWAGTDALVMKFTTSGIHVWSRQFGTDEADVAYGSAVDVDGNVYVVGKLGQYNSMNNDNRNAFLYKYSSSGDFLDSELFGKYSINSAMYWKGQVFVAGHFTKQPFVRGFDADLSQQSGLDVDNSGFGTARLAMFESIEQILFVGGSTYESLDGEWNHGQTDLFLRKHNSALELIENGTILVGTESYDYFRDMAVDGFGNVYICGRASKGDLMVGSSTIAEITHQHGMAFVSKFDSNLQHQWTEAEYLGLNESFYSLAADANGNVYVGGKNTLRKYDGSGDLVFEHDLDGAIANGLHISHTGELYLVGTMYGDIFVARMAL